MLQKNSSLELVVSTKGIVRFLALARLRMHRVSEGLHGEWESTRVNRKNADTRDVYSRTRLLRSGSPELFILIACMTRA